VDTPADRRQGGSVADVGYIAIVVAGLGAYWWRFMRTTRPRSALRERFAADAEVALHVAMHEASTRNQEMSSIHVLYGLLQDETVCAAIATAGGDAEALEDRVLTALATALSDAEEDARWVIGRAARMSSHSGRRASCTDLWAYLGESHAAKLLDDLKLDRGATLFALFHGGTQPEVTLTDARDVFVVLRNDDYTTQEFVCSILGDVFGLSEAQASAMMLATHTSGRAVVGRFTASDARAKIHEVRTLARAHAFPLWIGIEPA
jgi:ATP-dependent Clp protease adaptor protein ClpS